jgi:hypothetical protein
MDKNKFWLGGRLFNTASPRLGAPTQRRACPQVGHPNATQGTSASWAPQRTSAMQMKLTSITQGTSARPQLGRPNATQGTSKKTNFGLEVDFLIWPHQGWAPQRNASCVRNMGAQTQHKARPQVGRPNATQGTSASWVPQSNARQVCNLGEPAHVRNANARHVHTSPCWTPQHNARHVRKMVTQTQNSSATKTSTQVSTRLKDELEDG